MMVGAAGGNIFEYTGADFNDQKKGMTKEELAQLKDEEREHQKVI